MYGIEVARQITFYDPATSCFSAILKLYLHSTDRVMHAALRPEAIGKTVEVALPYWLHHHKHGTLDNTVYQGGNTQWA